MYAYRRPGTPASTPSRIQSRSCSGEFATEHAATSMWEGSLPNSVSPSLSTSYMEICACTSAIKNVGEVPAGPSADAPGPDGSTSLAGPSPLGSPASLGLGPFADDVGKSGRRSMGSPWCRACHVGRNPACSAMCRTQRPSSEESGQPPEAAVCTASATPAVHPGTVVREHRDVAFHLMIITLKEGCFLVSAKTDGCFRRCIHAPASSVYRSIIQAGTCGPPLGPLT